MPTLLIYGLMALAVLGAIGGFVGYERKAGGDSVRAELQPKLTACEGQVATMGDQIKKQNAAVDALKAESARRLAESAQALKAAAAKGKVWEDNAARLRAALTNRRPDGPKDCKSAWTEIRGAK